VGEVASLEKEDDRILHFRQGLGEVDLIGIFFGLALLFDHLLSRVGQHGGQILGKDFGVKILIDSQGGLTGPIFDFQARLHDLVVFFNGIITNDKFCLSRMAELQLNWWRRPLRLR